MTIRIDSTQISTVVWCTRCPYWHAFVWTRTAGHREAVRHEQTVHPGITQAQKAAHKFLTQNTRKVEK